MKFLVVLWCVSIAFISFGIVTGAIPVLPQASAHEQCDLLTTESIEPCEAATPETKLSCLLSKNTNEFNRVQEEVVEHERLRTYLHNEHCGSPSFYHIICTYDSLAHTRAVDQISILVKRRRQMIENYKEEILRDCIQD